MNTPGTASLWVRDVNGDDAVGYEGGDKDQEQLVTILHVETEHGSMQLVFRRGEFSKLMAHPNNGYEIEVALNLEEFS